MALWKEPTEREPWAEQPQRYEPEPAPAGQTYQRKESVVKEHHESFFATGVTIEGKIEGDGDVRIAGKLKGDIDVKGNCNIDRGAQITGTVSAGTVTIEGELNGNIIASDQVKLMESGQMVGDLKAKTLTVAAGSRMRGNVEFGWGDIGLGKIANGKAHEKGGKEPARANGSAV